MPESPVPAVPTSPDRDPLDRSALERVLARAAELQAQQGARESGSSLSDDEILELGREVGLTPDSLRQAIAEERGRLPVSATAKSVGGWLGSDEFAAARIVRGIPNDVLSAIDKVVSDELPFGVKRRFPDRMHWEPRRTLLTTVRGLLTRGADGADLRFAEELGAGVAPIDGSRTHVRVSASLAAARNRAQLSTAAVVLGGIGTAAIAAALGVAPLVGIPVCAVASAGITVGIRNRFRRTAERVATALEQLLDRLEFGPSKHSSRGLLD